MTNLPVLAVFDFDGTLTNRHTLWRYLRELVGPARFHRALWPRVVPVLSGRQALMSARDTLFARLLAGLDQKLELFCAQRFAVRSIPAWLRPEGLARLSWHKAQGHTTVILSNSAESYLRAVGQMLNVDLVLGTRFECVAGSLTGRVEGASCVGAAKVDRLRAAFGDLSAHHLVAYGDSLGDRELLAIADEPHFRSFR